MTRLALAPILAFALFTPAARAGDEEEIPLDKVPAKALEAVRKAFPQGKLDRATKGTDEDGVYYSIHLRHQKRDYEVTVTPDGTITEIAKEIEFKELPKPVAAAVLKRYPKAKIAEIAELTEPGVKGKKYHFELTTAEGKELEVVFDVDGKLVSEE